MNSYMSNGKQRKKWNGTVAEIEQHIRKLERRWLDLREEARNVAGAIESHKDLLKEERRAVREAVKELTVPPTTKGTNGLNE